MNEKSRLVGHTSTYNYSDELNFKFIKDLQRLKSTQRFKWAVPAQESEEANGDRFFSIRVGYACMFLSALSFTVSISSMWPYLQIIDTVSDASFLGWLVSSFSIGQLLSSPLFGVWANQTRCHKRPLVATILVTIVGNCVFLFLEDIGGLRVGRPRYWMLAARFLMGAGAATASLVRSYASAATSLEERTAVLANLSTCQGFGFIVGPILQAALVPLGFPGRLNMFNCPAFLAIIVYCSLGLVVVFKFNEYAVLDYASQSCSSDVDEEDCSLGASLSDYSPRHLPLPDYTAIGLTLLLFFINCVAFGFYQTLSSPLTMDMYAWTKREATLYNGLLLGGFGVLAVVVVLISKPLARRCKESDLVLAGYILLLIGIVTLLPWDHTFPSIAMTTIKSSVHHNNTREGVLSLPSAATVTTKLASRSAQVSALSVCPLNYEWCYHTPIVLLYQYVVGLGFLVCGYSVTNIMSFTIYSKLFGPMHQGTMMSLLTSVCLASRAAAPIVASYLYSLYGPRVSFTILAVIVAFAIVVIVISRRRYVPYKFS